MTRYVPLRHGRVACNVTGSGPTLLLIHGAEADRRSFAAMTRLLATAATVVIYDQRGCGESLDDGSAHTVLDLADDACDLLRALELAPACVFGTSFGGRVAQALALRHPACVSRLVLCNTWPLAENLSIANPAGADRLQALRAGLPATVPDLAAMFYGASYVARNPEAAQRFARAPGDTARGRLVAETHALSLADVQAPTLLLSGALDPIAPTDVMRRMQSEIPRSRLVVMPETAHSAAAQRPEALCEAILDFMALPVAHGGCHA